MGRDGSSPSELMSFPEGFIHAVSDWSSDGKWVAFTLSKSGRPDIYLWGDGSVKRVTVDGRSSSASFSTK